MRFPLLVVKFVFRFFVPLVGVTDGYGFDVAAFNLDGISCI